MHKFWLKCLKCGRVYSLSSKWIWRCSSCYSPLDTELDLGKVTIPRNYPGIWKFIDVLPCSEKFITYLGEGSTPLVIREFRGVKLLLKLEYLNPTGSFKDRGSAVTLSKVLELGIHRICEDSSGNAGLSLAAYSSSFSVKCRIYVPRDSPESKRHLIELFGAELIECPSREVAYREATCAELSGYTYVGHLWNPIYIDGVKTIAYELALQLRELSITDFPSFVVVPVASGTLLLGLAKGFRELKQLGLVSSDPIYVAVQGTDVAPLARYVKTIPCEGSSSLLDALRVPNPPRLSQLVDVINKSGGLCILTNNNHVIKALKTLCKWGFVVEPTSASVLAAIEKLIDYRILESGDVVFAPLTGSGLKVTYLLLKLTTGSC
ncbi:MAG: threonine synthase [Thermoprotei archaeon]|nr:MAG: threonine synthase [Thermoprotei archaeon]